MPRTRWVHLLMAALLVDLVSALAVDIHETREMLRGSVSIEGIASVAGLAMTLVVVVTALGLIATLYASRRQAYLRGQSLAADASISTDWVWECDTDHRLTYSSDGVRDLLGYAPDDVVGRRMLSLLTEDQRPIAEALVHDAVERKGGWPATELTWLHADGSQVVLHGQAAPIKDEHGRVVGFRGHRRAITATEHAARAAAAARERIRAVVRAREFGVALQPIVDLVTGRLGGVEALARFGDGRSPDVWFADALAAGLSTDLDRATFTRALEALEHLPPSVYLSINATPELVLSGHLADDLLNRGLPLERIVIEITEHARIDDYDSVHTALTQLREHGVRLAIDDTGAGYASLSHVLKLRPDIIKIDRALITRITSDPARRSLVTALVLLALDLGASITAEGIETPSELETVATIGADHGQGYLLARPSSDPGDWQRWAHRNWLTAAPNPKPGGAHELLSTLRR